jgi:hypothetical protein
MLNKFETIQQLDKNIPQLIKINENRFKSFLGIIRRQIKATYEGAEYKLKEMVDLNNIINDLYRAFVNKDARKRNEFLELVNGHWKSKNIKGNMVVDTTDFNIEDLSVEQNIRALLEMLKALFDIDIELNNQNDNLQRFKDEIKAQTLPDLFQIKNRFVENSRAIDPEKYKTYNEEIHGNFDILEEIISAYSVWNILQEKGSKEEETFFKALSKKIPILNKAIKDFKIQSIITYSNKIRGKSLKYLVGNLKTFQTNIVKIYDKIKGLTNPDKPQDDTTKLLNQVNYFSNKFECIKNEIKDHILVMKKLRTGAQKHKHNQKDIQLKIDSDIIFRYVSVKGVEETAWTEFWDYDLNTMLAKNTLDYDVKVLREKLLSLFDAQLRSELAHSLTIIKSRLNEVIDKEAYLDEAIANIYKIKEYIKGAVHGGIMDEMRQLAKAYSIEVSFEHIQYKNRLLNALLHMLQQFHTLYNTILTLTPNDIYLRNISDFEIGQMKEYRHLFGAYLHTNLEQNIGLFYNEKDFKEVKLMLREFQLMFVKSRLIFFADSKDIDPMRNDITDNAVIELSISNLLILSEVEIDFDAKR